MGVGGGGGGELMRNWGGGVPKNIGGKRGCSKNINTLKGSAGALSKENKNEGVSGVN